MKLPAFSPLSKLAALGAFAIAPLSLHADTSVPINLSGKVLKTGPTISAASSASLSAASAYDYVFTGTMTGSGALSQAIPPGTDIAEALTKLGFYTQSEGGLKITVFNPGGTLPFNVFSRTGKISKTSDGVTVKGSATAKVAINSAGIAKLKVINPKLKVTTVFGPIPSSVAFDSGATCTVSVTPSSSETAKPDAIILLSDNTGLGNNVYNTTGANQTEGIVQKKGTAKKYRVAFQNDGATSGSYTVTAAITGDASSFTVSYTDEAGKAIADLGATGADITLAASATSIVNVKVKAAPKAASGAAATITFTISGSGGSDVVVLSPSVK